MLIGTLIFASAGILHYPQWWLFMAILFVPMFAADYCKKNKRRRTAA
ncbi:MAG: hypothetical protein IJ339_06150 [Oscillospiraceae bacterium]|nr:hypothetical protein [Oscillospiraceae bacterium]